MGRGEQSWHRGHAGHEALSVLCCCEQWERQGFILLQAELEGEEGIHGYFGQIFAVCLLGALRIHGNLLLGFSPRPRPAGGGKGTEELCESRVLALKAQLPAGCR